jgi:DnaJ-class molecular chaperone
MLAAPVDRIVGPTTIITIPYEGMPAYLGTHHDEYPKGNLYIKFLIKFPKTLTEDQRLRVKRILAPSHE